MSGPFLHRSWLNVPHVTHNDDADITELDPYRKQLDTAAKADGNPYRVTLLAFLVKAVVGALKQHPEFNKLAHAGEGLDHSQALLQHRHRGRHPRRAGGPGGPRRRPQGDRRPVKEFGAISAKARDGKLGPVDMQGGTFTISSLGGIGGTSFTPIVNAPEVAILGVVRSAMSPVWNGTEFVPATCCRCRCPMTTGSSTARSPPGSPGTSATCSRTTGACSSDRPPPLHPAPRKECGMAAQEIRVPDIGDFSDVPVIEVLVAPGDTVAVRIRCSPWRGTRPPSTSPRRSTARSPGWGFVGDRSRRAR